MFFLLITEIKEREEVACRVCFRAPVHLDCIVLVRINADRIASLHVSKDYLLL